MTTFDKAPLPPQKGIMLDLCTITAAAIGGLSLPQLSAALHKDGTACTNKQIMHALTNSVYRGYLIVDKTLKDRYLWKVAPRSYYNARRAKMKVMEAGYLKKRKAHVSYVKTKAKKASSQAVNGLLIAVDAQIKSLAAKERGIHNKIDKLRKVRDKIAVLEL